MASSNSSLFFLCAFVAVFAIEGSMAFSGSRFLKRSSGNAPPAASASGAAKTEETVVVQPVEAPASAQKRFDFDSFHGFYSPPSSLMEKRFDLDGYFGGGGDQPYYTSGYYGGYGGQPTLRKRFDLSGYGGFYDATGSAEKRSSGYRGRDRVIAFL